MISSDFLVRVGKRSLCHTQVVAVGFDKRGNIVGWTTNRPRFSRKGGGIHAELRLIAERKSVRHIIIARIKNGRPRPIQPCPICEKVIRRLNITWSTVK